MPITYDSTTNTITVVGGTEDNPYTFEDIYNADQANGWGVFTKLSEGVYKTTAKLKFGDGATETWFKEAGTTLIAENLGTVDEDTIMRFEAYCNAQFGEYDVVNGKKVTKNGVEFQFRETVYYTCKIYCAYNSNVKYYGCKFKLLKNSHRIDIEGFIKEIIGCLSETLFEGIKYCLIEDVMIIGREGHISGCETSTFVNVWVLTTRVNAIWLVNATYSYVGLVTKTTDYLATAYKIRSPNVIKFINCKAHNWKIRWYLASGDVSGELQRIYACKFKVTDVNGNPLPNRTIKVYDKNGNIVAEVTTDENGLTDETEILYAKLVNPYADDTWHEFGDEDWEYFNPFTVEVWYGNELEYKGILTDLDVESTFVQITVKPSSFTLDDIYNLQDKIRKYLTNRWKIENNRLIIYDDDGITPILKFDLYDKFGNPTEINVYERKPVK